MAIQGTKDSGGGRWIAPSLSLLAMTSAAVRQERRHDHPLALRRRPLLPALWALEEVGAPYRLEILPFPPRYLAREYLQINPLGTIPLMIDGDVRMTESAAICQYLAERYAGPPLAVRPDEPGYGAYLNALHFGEATLTFPQTIVLRYTPPRTARAPPAAGGRGLYKVDARPLCRPRKTDGGRRATSRRTASLSPTFPSATR